ncbi:MAG: CoA-transferase subunit beta, partial [Candidatus Geothermincolia bacterium]
MSEETTVVEETNDIQYTLRELVTIAASRVMVDGESVFVGTGLPLVAALLAKKTHAPNMLTLYECGGVDPEPRELPWSVSCPWTYYKAPTILSMSSIFGHSRAGYADVGFLGGAQIDMYGNINATCIGAYDHPSVRLTGSGGANDIASLCDRVIFMGLHLPQRFPERVDYVTTPGFLSGPGERAKAGLLGRGPWRVVTHLGVLGFDEETCRMKLLQYHPGVNPQIVQDCTGF